MTIKQQIEANGTPQVKEIFARLLQAEADYAEAKQNLEAVNTVSAAMVSFDYVTNLRANVARQSGVLATLENVMAILSPEYKAYQDAKTQEWIAKTAAELAAEK